jgi:hypothetical protein
LEPGVALLATTAERVRIPDRAIYLSYQKPQEDEPSHWLIKGNVAELRLKSSAARNGLDHALAGWVDPGFDGTLTLELHAHRPIELFAGKAYVQMIVAAMLAAPTKSVATLAPQRKVQSARRSDYVPALLGASAQGSRRSWLGAVVVEVHKVWRFKV